MGYWAYYLLWFGAAYALQYPWLIAGAVAFFLLRRFIPDPIVLLRTLGHVRRLRAQIAANPANVTARRDLAWLYLERLRPRAALSLLDEALRRTPREAELLFLQGVARHRVGRHDAALEPLVLAVDLDPRVRFGEPYLVAGDALSALGRVEEAVDAYERYVGVNSSSIEGHFKLARARKAAGDTAGAREALDEARDTFRQLPGYRRRKELGWWLRASAARMMG
jgi:tetratricopeptide (TPR) repeat protein